MVPLPDFKKLQECMETTTETSIGFSHFSSVRSKCATATTLEQFVADIRSDRFRPQVERYRRLRSQGGQEAEAQRVKSAMPCVTPSAHCFGGHAVSDLRQYSGLLCIDLDHTADRTDAIVALAAGLPYVAAVFRSISGEGVKVFVRIRTEDLDRGYAPLYAAVGRAVSRCVGHAYDEKCAPVTQPCYYSWDPAAHFRPDASTFPYRPEEEAPAAGTPCPVAPQGAAGAVAVPAPVASAGKDGTDGGEAAADEPGEGFLEAFVHRFEQEYPFRPGQRNDIALRLGRSARRKGFSRQELDGVIGLYASRHAAPDLNADDIRQRVVSGYQYVSRQNPSEKAVGRDQSWYQGSFKPGFSAKPEEDEGEVLEKNEALMAALPLIPQEVYAALPPLLERCVRPAVNAYERDFLLLGSLNSCSALLPRVRFLYKRVEYSPHFYLAVVAPAGTGKGVVAFTASLLDATEDWYARLRSERKRKDEEAQTLWEQELAEARKQHRKPDFALKPEEEKMPYFKLPATISKSRLIECLAAAGEAGCAMATTEMATLTEAIGTDYGRFEDILLKAAHHEEVASSYKVDGLPLVARRPRLALAMSGTPEQFARFFRSLETGLYSRFAVCTRPLSVCWESCAPDSTQPDLGSYFHTLGEELLGMHLGLLESPTQVNFTPAQWKLHTAFFSRLLAETHAEGRDTKLGIIFRHGLLAMRLAALLTVFRKWDGFRRSPEYTCTDDDFRSALLVTRTVLEHSLLLCTSLPDSNHPVPVLRKSHLLERVLSVLPKKFSYTEFVETAMTCDMSISTAKRMLQRAHKLQLIVKQKDKYRKKRAWRQTLGLSEPEPKKRTLQSPKPAERTMKRTDNPVNTEAHEEA